LHSGIGDSAVLNSLGIKPIHHLPDVGRNLSEHPLSRSYWLVNSTDTFESFDRNPADLAAVEKQWNETRTGPLGAGRASFFGFFRLPDNASIFDAYPDPASGPITPHYELLVAVRRKLFRRDFNSPTHREGYLVGLLHLLGIT
jgi:choline dehydrogenase-like flavoprotein